MISSQRLWCSYMRNKLNLVHFLLLSVPFTLSHRTNIFNMITFFYYDIFMSNGKSFAARAIREVYYAYFFQSTQFYPEQFSKL